MNAWQSIVYWATTTGQRIIISVILLLVSFRVINKLAEKAAKSLEKNGKLDKTLSKTLTYVIKIGLKVLIVVCIVGYLGIETSGISAVIASLGVCAGLAVNGTLSNLAGGVMLLITRPFKLGDYISAQGSEGTVEDIRISYTKIKTVDSKVIYLPNSALSTGTIVNFSEDDLRRVDLVFSVAGNDSEKVRALLLGICADEELVLTSPEPFARITDYGAGNGLKITLRAWVKSGDYWDAYFNLLDRAQKTFDAEKIVVPFNQLDVHIKNT